MGMFAEQQRLGYMLNVVLVTLLMLPHSYETAAVPGLRSDGMSSRSGKVQRRMDVQMQTSDSNVNRRLSLSSYLQLSRSAEEAIGGHEHRSSFEPSKKMTMRMGREMASYASEDSAGTNSESAADSLTKESKDFELGRVSKRMNLQMDFASTHADPVDPEHSEPVEFDHGAAESYSDTHHKMQPLEEGCLYTITIITGNKWGAGTDATISLGLYDSDEDRVYFPVLDNGKNNFEKGQMDTFTELGPCVENICKMVLSTDNSGLFADWYVDTVSFSVTAPKSGHQEKTWELHQWLPKDDASASLFVMKDDCSYAFSPSPPFAP